MQSWDGLWLNENRKLKNLSKSLLISQVRHNKFWLGAAIVKMIFSIILQFHFHFVFIFHSPRDYDEDNKRRRTLRRQRVCQAIREINGCVLKVSSATTACLSLHCLFVFFSFDRKTTNRRRNTTQKNKHSLWIFHSKLSNGIPNRAREESQKKKKQTKIPNLNRHFLFSASILAVSILNYVSKLHF